MKKDADLHPDYHQIKVVMTDGTEFDDLFDLRQGGRQAAPSTSTRPRTRPGPAATST